MKRIKSMGLSICALLIAAAIFLGGIGTLTFAFANEDPDIVERSNAEFFSTQIVDEVEFSKSFKVPADNEDNRSVTVKAPNGQYVKPDNEGNVTAWQLGNYIVEIKDSDVKRTSYTYSVYCSMTEEYAVYVDNNGAKIPTYMQAGDSFEVPNVVLAYLDDNGELQKYVPAAGNVNHINGFKVEVTEAIGTFDAESKTVSTSVGKHGTMILKYSINLQGGKYYSKEFKINVQKSLEDSANPKFNGIVNVPTTANINTKVTLPIASATDDFDENVFVEIKVTHVGYNTAGNEVTKVVNIDETTGYAIPNAETDTEVIVFDNARNMSFYPTKTGSYKVSYIAIDDSGKPSTPHFYTIECTDGLAPIFTDFNTGVIPATWGLSVTKKNPAGSGVVSLEKNVNDYILLPLPTVADNADERSNLTLSVRITDEEGRTVLRFTNVHDALEGRTGSGNVASNTLYDGGASQTFEEEGFKFFVNKYDVTDQTGVYKIEYRVTDTNSKTRTYSPGFEIMVERSFEDIEAPTIDHINTVRYILLGANGDKTLEIPKVVVSDKFDTDPATTYTMTFTNSDDEESEAVTLDKADVLDIEPEGEGYVLVNDKGFRLPIDEGTLSIVCQAKDDVGNDSSEKRAEIAVYRTEGKMQNTKLTVDFDKTAENLSRITTDNKGNKVYKSEINLGNFKIEGNGGDIDTRFTGFEVTLKDGLGNIVPVTLDRLIVDDVIYVKNLSFFTTMVGWHDLYIRTFDITGASSVYMYSFDITGQLNTNPPYSIAPNRSATISNAGGNTNTRYTLKNTPNQDATEYLYVLRVSGHRFALIGSEFIAKEIGTYSFQDYIISADSKNAANELKHTAANDYSYDKADLGDAYETYHTAIKESAQPVIELLGDMKPYIAKREDLKTGDRFTLINKTIEELETAGWAVLPSVSAFNRSVNAEVSISINADGVNAYKVYQNKDGKYGFFEERDLPDDYFFTNMWAFAPHNDGAYNIEYTAAASSSNKAVASFTILVGKIVAPTFSIDEYARKAYSVDKEFKFFAITDVKDVENVTTTQIQRYTYTKTLFDPNGNRVASVSGDYNAAAKENNGDKIILDKSGPYTEVYEVEDSFGNKTVIKRTFQVAAKSKGATTSMKMLSVILIIVTILILAGVIFYIVRFRAVKKIKK